MKTRLEKGDIVKHFKRETVDKNTTLYLYKIINIATHSESKELMVVYQGLYDDFLWYVRPYEMFMSKVDKEKYKDIKQEYRFEKTTLTKQEKEIILKRAKELKIDIDL